MSQNRQQASKGSELVADVRSEDENKDLDEFCESVEIEEITLEQWSSCHKNLDLQFPVFVSAFQLEQAQSITVRLSRTIRKNTPSGRTEKREKIEHTFELKALHRDRNVLVLKGRGDQCDDSVGDLIVIIRIKDET